MADRTGPEASRPHIPGYGLPTSRDGLLPWSHAASRLEAAHNYWVGTARRSGKPHVVPVQGVWVEDALYFGGGPDTRWARNLTENPYVVVHLESGDDVVIIEGAVGRVTESDGPIVGRIQDAYESKYGFRHPPPFWTLRPGIAFGWTDFATDTTRWRFSQ